MEELIKRLERVIQTGAPDKDGMHPISAETVLEVVRQLPPIQPKRGRWIKLDMHRGMADHKCTACEQECYVPTCMGEPMYAFCPNCGADMREVTE